MKKYSLVFLVVVFPLQLFSQQLNFQVYSVNKGLPQTQVHDIAQTQNGYLWVATYGGGLAKFDGTEFINYSTEDGLRDNLVEELLVDSNDNLWVATDKGGIAKFQGDSLIYPIENDSLDKYSVTGMKELSDGSLWLGTYKGGVFILRDEKIKRLKTSDGLSSNIIWEFLETENGKVWMATNEGVSVYDGTSFKNYSKENGLIGNRVYKIIETKNGEIWIATNNGLSIWDGNSFKNIESIKGDSLESVYDLIEASNGKLWIATRFQGIYTYKNGEFNHITEKNGLSSNLTYHLFEDRNNRIWIGTDEDGINLYKENGFLFYKKDNGLSSNEILSVHQDDENTFWFGTSEGIESFDGNIFRKHPLPKKYQKPSIWNIIGLPNGNKLIAMPDSLMEFDGQTFTNFSEKYGLDNLYVYDLMVDSSNHLWIGADSGLYEVDLESKKVNHFTIDDGLADDAVFHIFEDREGRKWIGTYYGLNLYDGKSFKTYRIKDGLVHNQINYVTQDDKGDIWVGTRGGISLLKSVKKKGPFKIENFGKKDGMNLLNTHFLWFDKNGFLWQGTNGGLQKLDVESYRESGKMPVTYYPLSDEGIGLEFNSDALAAQGKQRAWMGSMGGVVSLSPNELEEIPLLNLIINDIKINTLPVNWAEYSDSLEYHNGLLDFPSVRFPTDKNIFEFTFRGVSFNNPDNIKYRYKLKGFKDEWMPITKDNSAVFTNLHPGEYTFVVQAKQNGGSFSDNSAKYNFAIAFPFWRSYWFYSIVIICVTALIFGYTQFRVNRLEKERLSELVDKQTEHLTDALKEKEVLIKEIHHRVKNNLAVISGLLELQMGHTEDDFVSRVLSESQRRVQSISMIHEKLYQNERLAEIDFEKYVRELIEIVAYSFSYPEKEIKVDIDIDGFKVGIDQGIPCGLILNELVSNAYEHAFKDQDQGTIEIRITQGKNDKIKLIVADNGCGFPEDFEINEKETLGLTLVDTLSGQLQGKYRFENTGEGTQFILEFKKEEAQPKVPT